MMIIIGEVAEVVGGDHATEMNHSVIEMNHDNEAKIVEVIGVAILVRDIEVRNLRGGDRIDRLCAEAITDILVDPLHLQADLRVDTVTMNLKMNCVTSRISVQMSLEDDFGVLRKSLKSSKTKN